MQVTCDVESGLRYLLRIEVITGIEADKIAILRQAINGDLDWKAKRHPKLEPLKLSKIEAAMSFTIAKGMVAQTAGKHYPCLLYTSSSQTS